MARETLTGNISNKSHTYSNAGTYTMKIDDALCAVALGGSATSPLFSGAKYVRLGDSVTNTGNYCFYNSSELISVDMNNVRTAGTYQFRYCNNLEYIQAKELTAIGTYAFTGCDNLSSIYVDNDYAKSHDDGYGNQNKCVIGNNSLICVLPNVEYFKNNEITAFKSTYTFRESYVRDFEANQITAITAGTFMSCFYLSSVNMDNLKTVASNSFNGCTSLTSIDLHDVTSIAALSFRYSSNLRIIDFSKRTLTTIPTLSNVSAFNDIA